MRRTKMARMPYKRDMQRAMQNQSQQLDLKLLAKNEGGTGATAAKAKSTSDDVPAIRGVLVRHEQAAVACPAIAADPDRYAKFLDHGLAMMLSCYGDSEAASKQTVKEKLM